MVTLKEIVSVTIFSVILAILYTVPIEIAVKLDANSKVLWLIMVAWISLILTLVYYNPWNIITFMMEIV